MSDDSRKDNANDAMLECLAAIRQVRAAFGPASAYGEGTREGKALTRLYKAHNRSLPAGAKRTPATDE